MGLLLAHSVVQSLRFLTGNERLYGFAYVFSLGAENNVPTLYASFTLLFSATLLVLVGLARQRPHAISPFYWFGLAAIFVFLALDESLEVHEKLIEPMRNYVDASGALQYPWVIPYAAAVLVFAAAYAPFLMRLPRRTAVLFILAGTIFVTGAIGFEMLSGVYYLEGVSLNPAYLVAQTFEELFEMGGIGIFIFAIADYIELYLGGVTIEIPGNPRWK